jgi:ribose transport system permease protein
MKRLMGIRLGLDRFSGLYLWAIFIIIFTIWEPQTFPTTATFHSVADGQATDAMMALAVLIPLASGSYDLSVGFVANLATILVVELQVDRHVALVPAIALTLLVCFVIGVLNGFIVVKLKVNSFIATLGTGTIIAAVQSIISSDQQPNPPTSSAWLGISSHTILGLDLIFWLALILGALIWWFLEFTPGGRYIFATGGNDTSARLSGVRVARWTWIPLILSATISGIAGILYGSLIGPSLDYGSSLLLPAFAAVFLGTTQFKPGRFNVWGTLVAVYALATGITGLQLVTGVQWLPDMFNGCALVGAVAFAGWRQRARVKARAEEVDEGDLRDTPRKEAIQA